MYNLISQLINHSWVTNASEQQYIYYICGAMIIILTIVFLDFIYRILRTLLHIS